MTSEQRPDSARPSLSGEPANRRGDTSNPRFQELFPPETSALVFAELGVWTSLSDCLAAARFIECRPEPDDSPSARLVIPFPDSDEVQTILIQCLQWLIAGYSVPPAKVRLAMALDPAIREETASKILDTKFRMRVDLAFPGTLDEHPADRCFIVSGDEYMIELVQNPLNCLRDMVAAALETVKPIVKMCDEARAETGGSPEVFHQPYADGPLLALVEALTFYVFGLAIGPNVSSGRGVNRGYRSVEVIGRPPIDPRMLSVAQELTEFMFRSIS